MLTLNDGVVFAVTTSLLLFTLPIFPWVLAFQGHLYRGGIVAKETVRPFKPGRESLILGWFAIGFHYESLWEPHAYNGKEKIALHTGITGFTLN